MTTKTVIRNGKLLEVDQQVLNWRKKMKKFKALKFELLGFLIDRLETAGDVEAWMNKSQAALGGAPPRQFLNPSQIKGLIKYAKETVKAKL